MGAKLRKTFIHCTFLGWFLLVFAEKQMKQIEDM